MALVISDASTLIHLVNIGRLSPFYRAEALAKADPPRATTRGILAKASERFKKAHLFSKQFDNIRGGKYIVVVVISEDWPANPHWIVTAYITRRLSGGKIEWQKQ